MLIHSADTWVAQRIITAQPPSIVSVRNSQGSTLKLDQGPSGELTVLDSGYTDQVLLDCVSEEFLRIKAVVYNSLNDLNKLFLVDRALYTSSPDRPLYYEFTPQNMASIRKPLLISEVKLYCVERLWGISTIRMMK